MSEEKKKIKFHTQTPSQENLKIKLHLNSKTVKHFNFVKKYKGYNQFCALKGPESTTF